MRTTQDAARLNDQRTYHLLRLGFAPPNRPTPRSCETKNPPPPTFFTVGCGRLRKVTEGYGQIFQAFPAKICVSPDQNNNSSVPPPVAAPPEPAL
jgi:hypothetical protein